MTVNPSSLWKVMDLVGKLSNKKVKVTFMGEVKVYTPLPLIIEEGFSSIGIECQKCGSCLFREKGFKEAGVEDPALRRL